MYSGIVYGHNTDVNGTNVTLKLDVYKPAGDTVLHRPVILLAFGGSFVFGTRVSPDIVQLCNTFAKKGYVCVSIDYRLGISPGIPTPNAVNVENAIWRTTHDMRAAVRWLRMNANVDSLGIDTGRIIVGGVSAGGFGALHCAYLDEESEIPADIDTTTEGGIEGNSGNPGYSSRPWAVINLCGALLDTSWIKPGDPLLVTLQGNKDQSVPYCTEIIKVLGSPIGLLVAGGNSIERRAVSIGLPTGFYTWWGADHTPFVLGTSTATYMDTTIRYIRDFLSHQLCASTFNYQMDSLTANYCAGIVAGIDEASNERMLIYNNVAAGLVSVEMGRTASWSIEVYDAMGRRVLQKSVAAGRKFDLPMGGLADGVYVLRVSDGINLFTGKF
jgi:para-nitrobenzyl esterase